jgi:hypothetical protein|tara:strand:+ start:78 stop:218 length:141 start_codon:yes stop_codon:yes gene_type:complete
MIDKFFTFIFGTLDKWLSWIDKCFIEKPKKKKKKSKPSPEDLFNGE